MLKEGIMQDAIIDLDFTHFGLDSLPHSLLQGFTLVACALSHFVNACILNKLRKLEWLLVNSSLVLQIASFGVPMIRHGYRVPDLLQFKKKEGIGSSHIPIINQIRSIRFHLQLKDRHSIHELPFLTRELGLRIV